MFLWLTCDANMDSSRIGRTPSSCRRIRSLPKVADIVSLYLAPPAAAVVLCVDEKSGVQALDRTQPLLSSNFPIKWKSEGTTTSGTAQSICSVRWILRQASHRRMLSTTRIRRVSSRL